MRYFSSYRRTTEPAENLPDMHVWEDGNSEHWRGDITKQKERISMFMCKFQKTSFENLKKPNKYTFIWAYKTNI